MVSIPKGMTSSGVRTRKYFKGKTAAAKFAATLRQQHGSGMRGVIPVAMANQAIEAARILEGTGISIAEAARMAVARIATKADRETFKSRYYRALLWGEERWSARYLNDMEKLLRWAPSLMSLQCGTLDRERIEAALQEGGALSRSTLDMRVRYVRAVLGFRERHQKSATIHILTPDQQKGVLAACSSPAERWAVALLLYAGIRPDSESGEISRMNWKHVGVTEIYVPQEASKTSADRIIPVRPVLLRLLHGHPSAGSVTPPNWKRTWQRIRKDAGIASLQDVLRHTFASHHLAAFGEDATKSALGHTAGSSTIFRHYRRAVSEDVGKAFFE